MNTASRRGSARVAAGFTLIEILVVLAIISILAGIAYVGFARAIRANQVMDGARALAADLVQVRSAAQKTSQAASLRWTASADQPMATYTLTRSGLDTERIPSNTVVIRCLSVTGGACTATDRAIRYRPPFSETAQGAVFRVSSAFDPSVRPLFVKVGGVTGKVIFSEQQD